MSLCTVCELDSEKHSKALWDQHMNLTAAINEVLLVASCSFCQKVATEHSEELWETHKLTVETGRYCPKHHKEENLCQITLGFARTGTARICVHADSPYDKEMIPIYMSCMECGLYLGSTEEDHADTLDGMCLKCFKEMTGQTEMNER